MAADTKLKSPASTCLQGIKPPELTLAQTSAEPVSKLNLLFMPADWQVHLISWIQQGYDSVFLAGTGYGKSQSGMVIIISPLKALECDQVLQAMKKGIHAVLINEDNTKSAGLWAEVHMKAQMVYIPFKMALSAIFIKFFTRQEIPFVTCTATADTSTFNDIWKSLGFGKQLFWGIDGLCYYGSEATCSSSSTGVKMWQQALPPHLCNYAAEMGCSIPDVAFTVIFGCPWSLLVVAQQWG
ncbi:hypothetical protein L208DRAFT_1425395 [Tricholoma matsutake]|nr:hypothetical protein L208DRAFT_1425395 [Tricholoma matsutake 945]